MWHKRSEHVDNYWQPIIRNKLNTKLVIVNCSRGVYIVHNYFLELECRPVNCHRLTVARLSVARWSVSKPL